MLFHPPDTDLERHGDLLSRIAEFSKDLRQRWKLIATIGIGSIYTNHNEAAKSYLEAVSCLDYSFIRGRGAMIDAADIDEGQLSGEYPTVIFAGIDSALQHADYSALGDAIEELKNAIFSNSYPLYMVRMIGYELITKVRSHFLSRRSDAEMKKDLFSHIESLLNLRNIENLFREIQEMVAEYSDQTAGRNGANHRISSMLEYISAHFADADFSATSMADHFEMSRAGFSRYFRQHTGATFVDYVSRLRLDVSMEFLISTDAPIKEIVRRIGYSDSSAFIRKFREYVGETPLSYRKNMRSVAG
jgi:two-component system response regulator YesN